MSRLRKLQAAGELSDSRISSPVDFGSVDAADGNSRRRAGSVKLSSSESPNLAESAGRRPASRGSDRPDVETGPLVSASGRPASRGADRPDTTETVNTSRTGTAEAVKVARADNLAAEIAAKEEQLRLKKEKTVELRLKHFRKMFEQFDTNKTGAIDRARTNRHKSYSA